MFLDTEKLISLVEAGKLLPSSHDGREHLSRDAIYSWIKRGLKINGAILKLRAVKVGSGLFTTREWLQEFIDKTTAASIPAESPRVRSPAQRAADIAEADRVLEEAGI